MGLLRTRWSGRYEQHAIDVVRSELTRGFAIEWDGNRIAAKRWSWIGTGQLSGDVGLGDRRVTVTAKLLVGGRCELTVDGKPVDCTRTS